MSKNKTISRTLYSITATVALCIVIYILASILNYFHTGASKVNKYDVGLSQLAHHNPPLKWLPDDVDIKGEINQYIRKEIEQSYLDAWGILNLSILHQEDLGLKENWSDRKTAQITNTLVSQDSIVRSDLNHNIKLHFISYDKQVLSFTDKAVVLQSQIKSETASVITNDTADYQIIMTLDDGKYRINKFHRI